jgi:cell division protein FtsW (lipid II flippase)
MKFSARHWLIAVSGIAFALALLLIFVANLYNPFTYYFAFIAGIFFVGSLFERVRYKKLENEDPGPGWRETEERFIDPATKKRVTVFFNPSNGERRYVVKGNPNRQSR